MAAGDNLHPDLRTASVSPLPRAMFATAGGIKAPRSPASVWTAVAVHAVIIALIAWLVLTQVHLAPTAVQQVAAVNLPPIEAPPPPPPPVAPAAQQMHGGGGQHDVAPPTQGHLPKIAPETIVPPKAPPVNAPKLAVEPTVNIQQNLKLADNKMPDLGLPNSGLKGVSPSFGTGSGTGIGSGHGNGIGPGGPAGMGGGIYQIGGSVRAPVLTYSVDPEFSEEARKAKFSGNVQVALVVDEQGRPKNIRVERGVGMGLDEKAVEAVRQYKFKPAMKDGHAVPVELYIEVNFQIF